MSREHLFGQWVSRLGLDSAPALHRAGPLNRIPRDIGEQPPFRLAVKDVCASCNNGWMSDLEATAQRALSPLVRGEAGVILVEDQSSIAIWVRKTALVAMLLSSEEQRANGYGLPHGEYRTLYLLRDQPEYLDGCQAWVGSNAAPSMSAVHVTPMCVRIPGVPEPDKPDGYLATVALGALVLQSLSFVSPALAIEMHSGMSRIWPSKGPASWPFGDASSEDSFRHLAAGRQLTSTIQDVTLEPWSRASQLPQSQIRHGMVEVPALCGQHAIRYPGALLREALSGRYHAFMTSCDCNTYLIHTAADSVRFKAAGTPDQIGAIYEDLAGDEVILTDPHGTFICKELPPLGGAS